MELGNLIFGNSRGDHPVSREQFQGLMEELLYKLDNNSGNYGIDFENDVFEVHPYWWNGCTCGFELAQAEFEKQNKHKDGCPRAVENWWRNTNSECTCDYYDRYFKFFKTFPAHKEDCKELRPNFVYKPLGYQLKWYKYALRDSYANLNLSLEEFRVMIIHCMASLEK